MKIKIRDIPTFYKILFPSIAITLMVTLTSTIFTYNKASEIILKKTVRQSQETVRQMSENYENFMQGIYDKINYIAYSATTQEELCYGEKGAYEEGYFSRERELKRQMVRLFNSFYVDDLQIYAKNGKDYYFSVKQEVKKPEKEEIAKMIQQATDAMGGIVCINDLKHSGHLQIVKEVRDNLKMSPIGTIRLSINSDALEQIRKNVNFASEGSVTGRRRHFRGRGRCLFLGGRMGLASLGRLGLLRGRFFRLGRAASAGLFRFYLFLGPRLGGRSFFGFCRAAPFGLGLLWLRHGLFPFLLAVLGDGNRLGFRLLGDVRRSILFRRGTHSGKVNHLCGRSRAAAHIRDFGLLHFWGLSRHFRRGLFLRGRGMLVFFCHDTNNLLDKNLGHATRLAHIGTQRKCCPHTKTPPMSC